MRVIRAETTILSGLLLALCLTGASGAFAASAGTSSGLIMSLADTARGQALSGATGTLTGDPGAVFDNPAVLHALDNAQGLFTHQTGLALDYSEIINFAFPVPKVGGVGVSLVYHGMPPLDDAGAGVPTIDVNDTLVILSFGRAEPGLLAGLAWGLNLKFLNSVIGEYSANAFAADVGFLWEPWPQAAVGLAVKHAGTGLKFIEDASPLPLTVLVSGKYYAWQSRTESIFVVLDVEQTREMDTLFHLGSELEYAKTFFIRAGYGYAPWGANGLSVGLGVNPKVLGATLRFDYAYRLNAWSGDSFAGTQLITAGMLF